MRHGANSPTVAQAAEQWLGAIKAAKVSQTPHEHFEEGALKCPK